MKLSIQRNREKISLHYCGFFLLKYLNEPNYDTLIALQMGIMEQTIQVIDKVSLMILITVIPRVVNSMSKVISVSIMNSERI